MFSFLDGRPLFKSVFDSSRINSQAFYYRSRSSFWSRRQNKIIWKSEKIHMMIMVMNHDHDFDNICMWIWDWGSGHFGTWFDWDPVHLEVHPRNVLMTFNEYSEWKIWWVIFFFFDTDAKGLHSKINDTNMAIMREINTLTEGKCYLLTPLIRAGKLFPTFHLYMTTPPNEWVKSWKSCHIWILKHSVL